MDQLQITLAQVTQTAASIRSQNQQLNSCLQEIGTSMNQLAAYWQSPASEKIRSRFHGMLPVFDNYRSIVESYAKFLDQTVSTYQSMEAQLNASAEGFYDTYPDNGKRLLAAAVCIADTAAPANRHAAKCSTGRRASPAAATVSQCPA